MSAEAPSRASTVGSLVFDGGPIGHSTTPESAGIVEVATGRVGPACAI